MQPHWIFFLRDIRVLGEGFLCTKGRLVKDPEILGDLNKGTPFKVSRDTLNFLKAVFVCSNAYEACICLHLLKECAEGSADSIPYRSSGRRTTRNTFIY